MGKKVNTKQRGLISGNAGFSLLEILLVIAIIIILAGAMTPILTASKSEAKKAKAQSEIDAIKTAAMMLRADTGYWPTTSTDGSWLVADNATALPDWDGPYLDEWKDDPWGNPYEIKDAGVKRYIASQGPTAGYDVTFPTGNDDVYLMLTSNAVK